MEHSEKTQERLAVLERQLSRLQAQYELAMSRFKFDDAAALQAEIAVLESEQGAVARGAPMPRTAREPEVGVVPVLHHPPRRRRRLRCRD